MTTFPLKSILGRLATATLNRIAPDYLHVVRRHYWRHGELRFFVFPRTYNELLKHKMLFDRNPVLTETVDKYAVRDYVARRIGAEHLIPLHGVYEDPATIPIEALPRPYVLKATHGSGFNLFIREAADVDRPRIVDQLKCWLATDFYERDREWAYKNVPRRIIAERMLMQDGKPPFDFKFFVFNGKVRLVGVVVARNPVSQVVRFDEEWRPLSAVNVCMNLSKEPLARPDRFADMVQVAERLGSAFSHVRIDLYEVGGRVYFGEITQYPLAGASPFSPRSFDRVLGDVWRRNRPIPDEYYADHDADYCADRAAVIEPRADRRARA